MVTINDTKTMQHLQIVLEQKRLAILESDIKMDNFTNFIITKKNEIKLIDINHNESWFLSTVDSYFKQLVKFKNVTFPVLEQFLNQFNILKVQNE
jgi:hypothetical protein